MKGTFFKVTSMNDKASALRCAARAESRDRFSVNPREFASLPGAPFAYWVSAKLRKMFIATPPFEAGGKAAKQGLATTDDFRFVRCWWEIDACCARAARWFPFSKGGEVTPYYGDLHLVVDWFRGGAQSWAIYQMHHKRVGGIIKNPSFYGQPGLTYSLRGARFRPRILPKGSIFSVRGSAIFLPASALAHLAFLNSSCFDYLLKLLLGRDEFPQFDMGDINMTPVPEFQLEDERRLSALGARGWSLVRMAQLTNEISHAFILPRQILNRFVRIDPRTSDAELEQLQREIDEIAFRLYGVDGCDRDTIDSAATRSETLASLQEEDGDGDAGPASGDLGTETDDLMSWAAGIVFGRFEIRLANGERTIPPDPDPFDPLPTHSPGMLVEPYPGWCIGTLTAPPACLVDDPGHANDITAALRVVYDHVDLDAPEPESIRRTLARDFFTDHIKRYSKSRRKAPIYWQLATSSASYSVWLYYHRFSRDTLYTVQNDYLAPKLRHEESKLESLRHEAEQSPTSATRKALAAQEIFVDELRTFLDEVKRVAPLWDPNLDDGVIINFAPLWRLVPQHRAWQKECKDCWDSLCAGEYDWAHLSMNFWPERVIPKCREDRSLAIAHGLEDLLWVQDFDDKWRSRRGLVDTIAHVVDRHYSPAMQAAVSAVRAFWKQRFADAGCSDAQWWMELEAGMHDDVPVALALWPGRVLEKATKDPTIARAHNLVVAPSLPAVTAAGPGKRRKAREKHIPLLTSAELSTLAAFCCELEGQPSWAARWRAWDAGAFDDRSPLALHVRTNAVVHQAAEHHAVALTFGLERWFWIETSDGIRRLREPEEELRQAIAQRESVTVKAALKSLLEAPTPGAGGALRGGGRRRRGDAG
ncbi:hypothetical protein WMF11_17665 [Sorangium sp. So ce295]|uniref:hypothetical protein n=1 Tax=Sorangium sp. So ce295 TaxID=3133295 RepID=UPI003F62CBA0